MPADEIEDILRRLLRDDPKAWTELVQSHSGLLLRVAGRVFAAYGFKPVARDAEDVVAEVWSNVLAHDRRIIRQCLARGHWLPTLYTLARNRAVDIMRAHKMQVVPYEESRHPEPPAEEPEPEPPIPREKLRETLKVLNPRERTLITLFFLQEKKYTEIAALTGIPQNSIGPTLGRALAKMRAALEGSREP